MRLVVGAAAVLLAVAATACGELPAASRGGAPTPGALSSPTAEPPSPSPTPSYQPGPDFASGKVLRLTPTGVVIDQAGTEIDVDLRSVVDVWKETSVPVTDIEVGDSLDLNGTKAANAFVARYVYVNIGRLDGTVLSFDGHELALALKKRWIQTPREVRVELSKYVELTRIGAASGQPVGRSDLTLGTQVGMVLYRPHSGLSRATRIWLETPAASPSPSAVLTRPMLGPNLAAPPVAIDAATDAGILVMRFGGTWWYYGPTGAVAAGPAREDGGEHPSPAGRLIAVERFEPTVPGGEYQVAKELALREQGVERVIYRASGDGFYWSGWSPDGRYVALWQIDMFSGSLDMDGRPLVVIDTETGERTELGKTLLWGTTAWTAPHTLAFIGGAGRMPWKHKTLRLWSPEAGIRDVTTQDVAAFGPAWSADGRSLFFINGPDGTWDPVRAADGRGVGDRRIAVWNAESGSIRTLPHEPGYVEEGVRPSRDGAHLLVLRRRTAAAADINSIPRVDLEVWLTDAGGTHGTMLVRFPGAGLSAYGDPMGPTEWEWSE